MSEVYPSGRQFAKFIALITVLLAVVCIPLGILPHFWMPMQLTMAATYLAIPPWFMIWTMAEWGLLMPAASPWDGIIMLVFYLLYLALIAAIIFWPLRRIAPHAIRNYATNYSKIFYPRLTIAGIFAFFMTIGFVTIAGGA